MPEATHTPTSPLDPWPARARRQGFEVEASGGFAGVLSVLPRPKDGLNIHEYMKALQDANPEHAEHGSAPSPLFRFDLDICIQGRDNLFTLNDRGLALLSTSDPDVLADHLLTTLMGPDHIVKALETRAVPLREMVDFLERVNPGKTLRNRRLLRWLGEFGVIELDATKAYVLTERGRRWAAMVTWTPEERVAS